jgi:hypothetical protein
MAIVEACFHYSLLLRSIVPVLAVPQFFLFLSACVSFVTDPILAFLQLIPSTALCIVLSHGAGAFFGPGDSYTFRKTLKNVQTQQYLGRPQTIQIRQQKRHQSYRFTTQAGTSTRSRH